MAGKVAWTGADHPFDTAAKLFVGLDFAMSCIGFAASHSLSASDDLYGGAFSPCNLVLELAGDSVSCPLYASGDVFTATDFVITAKKWWPYATKAGLPAWDEDTGLAINGGPAN